MSHPMPTVYAHSESNDLADSFRGLTARGSDRLIGLRNMRGLAETRFGGGWSSAEWRTWIKAIDALIRKEERARAPKAPSKARKARTPRTAAPLDVAA